MGVVGRGCVQE